MSGLVLVSPKNQFFDSSGAPLNGGTVTTYLAGTTTLATTYQDRALTTANTNPITLNARGECSIWGSISSTYKFVVKDSTGATIYTEDNVPGAGNTSDIAAAVVTALDDIADAQADADAALALAASYLAQTGEAVLDALIDDETSAIAISAEADSTYAMKVVDAANVLNNDVGGVLDILASTVFGQPKMVMDTDRRTVVWSPHNFCKQTNALSNNVTGGTATDNQVDSDGGTDACLLTATSAVISAFSHVNASSASYQGFHHMQEWIVRAGTSTRCYIAWNEGGVYKHAYFNLSTVALGTVDAGVTATISTTRPDGTALPTGYYRITAYFASAVANFDAMCGQCDADNSKAVTIGRTFYAEKAFLHLGVQAVDYFENTTTGHKIGVPYDYSKGGARILIEPAVTYNSTYADDLTNAAWTKTNASAAKTTTGPHGEPCSTLTATAGNGTCIQAIVSAGTKQNFSAFVRRRTGTGTISITSDNGATWTDITSLLNSTTYTRVQVAGTTNPSIGFKITTNADAIDVSLALNAPVAYTSSPRPVEAAATARAADPFIVPLSLLTSATAYTVYADYERITGTGFPDDANFRVGNTAMTQELWLGTDPADGRATFSVADGVTTKNYPIWMFSSGERMEVTAKLQANQHMLSINGEPPAWTTTVGMPTMNQVRLGFTAPVFLRRLLVTNHAVDRDDVRTWRYSGRVLNSLLASEVVAWDTDPNVTGINMNREPSVCVLSDDGEIADVAVFHAQRHEPGHHVEAPARLMQRNYRVDKVAGTLLSLTPDMVVQQQSGWASGDGHLQSSNAFVVPAGVTNAGRVILLFTGLELPDFTPDQRSIYRMTNDAGGDPTQWSAATEIVSAASGEVFVLDPSASIVILPPSHPVAPNRIITTYYNLAWVKSLYSDDGGTTWTSGTAFAPVGSDLSESALSVWPDGTVNLFSRFESGDLSRRNWAKSTDGGVTFVDQGALPAYSYSQCSVGAVQLDPTGTTGTYGKTAIPHAVNSASRLGLQIDFATDALMTFGSGIRPVATNRYFGYNSIKSLFGGTHMVVAAEGGSVPFNTDNTSYLLLIEAP